MSDSASTLIVTVFAALTGSAPQLGDECVLAAANFHARARLSAVIAETPDAEWPWPLHGRPHWSELASLQFELAASDVTGLMLEERARSVELWSAELWHARSWSEQTSGEAAGPWAAGLTVGVQSSVSAEKKAGPAARGLTVWLTGLSGAGKTTIACELERIIGRHSRVEMLDGDMVRTHLCKGLGFSAEDRRENVRRLAVLARLLAETGAVVLVSAISPYREVRDQARRLIGRFIEVYVNAPLFICEGRDVKGLYKRARRGEIQAFTGIDDPYEAPLHPEIECRTDRETIAESVAKTFRAVAREANLHAEFAGSTVAGAVKHGG